MSSISESNAMEMVLATIRDRSPQPTELLTLLEGRLSYREVQDALAKLLDTQRIELGSDRHLRLADLAA